MDRALFDRERQAVQAELEALGQHIEIPDPNDPQYFGVFLALQRSHPRLAARLQQAEQADPAELLDPFTPKASKTTLKHRLNAWVDQTFMRRGVDGTKVMDRQRVLKTALYSVGGVVTAGLIWSVVAPKPTPAPSTSTSTSTSTTQTNEAAYRAAETTPNTPATPSTPSSQSSPSGSDPAIFPTKPTAASDTPPSPVSTTKPAPVTSTNTPPPPAVFTEVPTNQPVSRTPVLAPAPVTPVNTPDFGGHSSIDSPPVPISSSASPVLVPAPTAPHPNPQAVSPSPTPPTKETPVTKAVPGVPTSAESPLTSPAPTTPPEIAAPFGGDQTAEPISLAAPSEPLASEARQRSALMYQAAAAPATQASSPLIYQQAKIATENSRANSALLYQASSHSVSSGSSLVYQAHTNAGSSASPANTPIASPPDTTPLNTLDPDAPAFSTASVIPGKLFTALRTAAGINAPAIVVTADGHWIGVATYNAAFGRVDMRFSSYVNDKNGKAYPVQASAYQLSGGALTPGVSCNVHPIAPTLALDLARAGLNSLSTYTQALQNAGTTTVNGSLITTTRQAPALIQVVRGELGKVFALPEGNQSINIVADVNAGTEIQLLYGISSDSTLGP